MSVYSTDRLAVRSLSEPRDVGRLCDRSHRVPAWIVVRYPAPSLARLAAGRGSRTNVQWGRAVVPLTAPV